jgi:hypothetical protein
VKTITLNSSIYAARGIKKVRHFSREGYFYSIFVYSKELKSYAAEKEIFIECGKESKEEILNSYLKQKS